MVQSTNAMTQAEMQQALSPEGVADPEIMAERRDVKVKLPSALVLRLYYLKLTTSLNYSDVVEDALLRYFADLDGEVGAVPGLGVLRGNPDA